MKRLFLVSSAVLSIGALAARPSLAVTTCDQFGTVDVAGKTYVVQNNAWNSAAGQQCIDVNTSTGAFVVTDPPNAVPTNGAPASYPSIFKGCHWGNCTNNSGMPLQVSSIGSATSSWSTSPVAGSWDVAYDIWFNTASTTSGQPNGAELMIWINHSGPPQPIGSQVATVSLAGASWYVWVGNVGWNVISYVRTSGTNSVSNLDLKAFFADAQSRGQIQSSWWLIAIEAGFEPWQIGAGFATNSFSASVSSGGGGGGGGTTGATLVNKNSGKCVDAAAAGTANGTRVQQWACNGTNAQNWSRIATDSGYIRIGNSNATSQVIDIAGPSTADGAKAQLWTWGGGGNQQWLLVSEGNGYYHLVARNSGKCLDVPAASTADGVQLQQWSCNGTGAQSFRLQ